GGNAPALFADEMGERRLELHLAGSVAPVPELVLEPLQAEAVLRPVREHARQEEAGEPPRGLREDQESVAHRRRAEPLVTGEPVRAPGRLGASGVRADLRAALLLGHRHADERAPLLRRGQEPRLVLPARDPRLPLARAGRPPPPR